MWVERNGKTFRIRDLAGGRKVTLQGGYATKTAAKSAMATMRADALRGDSLVPRGGRITLADWIAAFWPAYEVGIKPQSARSEGGRVRNHILPMLGHYALDDLAEGLVIQRWVSDLTSGRGGRRPLAAKTVRNCHGLLHKILGAAVKQRLIRANPCADTALPESVPYEMRFLTEPEAARLLKHVPAHWRPLVLLLVSTGLRWGEAAGLRVMDVDVLAGRLTVHRNMQVLPDGQILYGTPKTIRGRRTVTFPPATVGAALAGLVGKGRHEPVFTAPRGGPVLHKNFHRGWLKWTEAAGLGGLRVHDLRHTQAAWLISANVPLSAISRRLGHASIAVTDGLYGHLLPSVDEGIVKAVDAALQHIDPADLEAEIAEELLDQL